MAALSFVAMYLLMYAMVDVLGALLPRKVALKMARRSMGYFFPHLADKKP